MHALACHDNERMSWRLVGNAAAVSRQRPIHSVESHEKPLNGLLLLLLLICTCTTDQAWLNAVS